MEIKYSNIIVFFVVVGLLSAAYYRFMLNVDNGEDKKLKMIKNLLGLVFILGIVHIYSITDDIKLKQFFIVILAVMFNIYSVVNSTKQCNFPRLYVIRLSLYSAAVTFFIAGLIWYVSHDNNSLFGFMIDDEITDKVQQTIGDTFSSDILGEINLGKLDDKIDCPDPLDEDNYASEMNILNNSDLESDKQKYRDCLEQEVRADLEKGI